MSEMANGVDKRMLTGKFWDTTFSDHQESWEGCRESSGQRERVVRAEPTTNILEAYPTHVGHPQPKKNVQEESETLVLYYKNYLF